METKDSGVPELDEELRERLDWEQQLMAFETELLARESSVFERESAGLLHAKVLQRSIKSKRLLELEKEVGSKISIHKSYDEWPSSCRSFAQKRRTCLAMRLHFSHIRHN